MRVTIKDEYDKEALPQVWDELRKKVINYQNQLPPGAGPSLVNDDYGDVYGVYFALTGKGYTQAELKEIADMLKRELLLVQDVKKVTFYGEPQEVIYIEMSRPKMASLGISQEDIYRALSDKNFLLGQNRAGPKRGRGPSLGQKLCSRRRPLCPIRRQYHSRYG